MVYKWKTYIELMDPLLNLINGSKQWYINGKLHRTDGPAIEWSMMEGIHWYINGELHRTDGPAIEYNDGY